MTKLSMDQIIQPPPLLPTKYSLIWDHLFDSKCERSVYRFGRYSVHNGQPSHEIPWSAELPHKNCLRPIH